MPEIAKTFVDWRENYTEGDSDVISLLVFAAILWVELLEMFVTLLPLI